MQVFLSSSSLSCIVYAFKRIDFYNETQHFLKEEVERRKKGNTGYRISQHFLPNRNITELELTRAKSCAEKHDKKCHSHSFRSRKETRTYMISLKNYRSEDENIWRILIKNANLLVLHTNFAYERHSTARNPLPKQQFRLNVFQMIYCVYRANRKL